MLSYCLYHHIKSNQNIGNLIQNIGVAAQLLLIFIT